MSEKNLLSIKRTNLAVKRTKLANQRTLLAYMRTGFSIAAIAGSFKKMYLVYFGIFMILLSAIQYYIILEEAENKEISSLKSSKQYLESQNEELNEKIKQLECEKKALCDEKDEEKRDAVPEPKGE